MCRPQKINHCSFGWFSGMRSYERGAAARHPLCVGQSSRPCNPLPARMCSRGSVLPPSLLSDIKLSLRIRQNGRKSCTAPSPPCRHERIILRFCDEEFLFRMAVEEARSKGGSICFPVHLLGRGANCIDLLIMGGLGVIK